MVFTSEASNQLPTQSFAAAKGTALGCGVGLMGVGFAAQGAGFRAEGSCTTPPQPPQQCPATQLIAMPSRSSTKILCSKADHGSTRTGDGDSCWPQYGPS